uniref:SH3 domain-containing protein n=1 Tax=Denticeps clupeoides TaxID=299321 RepID=A0AAY4B6U9_9TELE
MILTVYLSDGDQAVTEVPITPETTCRDVVEFCKEPGEGGCHLAEVWRGNERAIPFDHMMYEHLQKWGSRKQEVKFYLRHEDSPGESDQGSQQSQEHANRRIASVSEKYTENGEQRLRYLKQQERRQQQAVSETEKLQRLKERVDTQEAKLKKIRAMRGQVDYSKVINGNLSAEIEHISGLFQEKQAELQAAVLRVEQLSQQLEDLRRGKLNGLQGLGGQVTGTAALELRKLYQELQIRNKLNQEQNSKLQQQKELLNKRNMEVTLMDKRIGELRDRLYKKKAEARQKENITTKCMLNRSVSALISSHQSPSVFFFSANDAGWPTLSKGITSLKPPDWKDAAVDSPGQMGILSSANSGSTSSLELRKDCPPRPLPNPPGGAPNALPPVPAWPRVPPSQGSSSQQIQQRISVPPSPTFQPSSPLFPPGERPDPPLAVAVRPFIPDKGSRPQSPRKGPPTMNSSSIYHMYLQQGASKNYPLKSAVKALYGKPLLPASSSSTPPSPLPFVQTSGSFPVLTGASGDDCDGDLEIQAIGHPEGTPPPPPSVDLIPRPLSPTKLTPMVHSPMRYQSDADLEVLRKKLANAPRPLKKRSSITEPEGPSGPNIQKLLYQRFNTLAGGMERTPFYQPSSSPGEALADANNGNPPSETSGVGLATAVVAEGTGPELPQGDANDNQPLPSVTETPPVLVLDSTQDDDNNNPAAPSATLPSPVPEAPSPEETGTSPSQPTVCVHEEILEKRSNLKKPDSARTGHGLRVKFNPLALLLDASLEGEFDLVQRIIYEVENPSKPNDEGITPLHNAVCAGHHHIVKFLLDFGVNVNAADSDGWTPLHCAASCNSVHLCKQLVESGAAIFATTISDVETAADKCEEMEEGYIQCSQFLYSVQEKLGVMNKGAVYALWDYEAQNADELSFHEGDAITILRCKDDNETAWWWARLNDKEGYVPRNLLGLYPRIKPRQRSLA